MRGILQRQAYIHIDAVKYLSGKFVNPTTSLEDRQRMDLPNKSAYKKWIAKLQQETSIRSPSTFQKAPSPVTFTKPEIKSSSKPSMSTSSVRKPSALTIDNEVYEAICSRKPTGPCSPLHHAKNLRHFNNK